MGMGRFVIFAEVGAIYSAEAGRSKYGVTYTTSILLRQATSLSRFYSPRRRAI